MRGTAENGTYTERLAEYCSAVRLEEIPAHVRERAKYVTLDGLACGVYGATLPWSKILTDTIVGLGGSGPSTAWGTGLTLPSDQAALLNGSFTQGFELDDYHVDGALHSCANVLPAALGCADVAGGPVSGERMLAAIVAGFETGVRVGQCMNASIILKRGWHSGSIYGTFAAAAAGGRVLGIDPAQMAHAFGIAGTQSSGLMSAQFGSMVKRMHHGRSAQSGLYAALLARNGYTGIERIFEERYGGFCTTFTATEDGFDLGRLVDGLGTRFETERIAIKPYACNGSIHTSLDAVRAIRERRPFASDEVKKVVVRCTGATLKHVGWEYKPAGMTAAQLNLSFGVAAMIEFGDVFVEQFTEETIRSPRLIELTRLVQVVHEPAFDALGPHRRHHVELTIDFRDGSREVEEVDLALGSPARPLPNDAIAAKYDRLARSALGQEGAEALKSMVLHMEHLDDARALGQLLRLPG